jgi:hypothetical protein
MLTGALARTGHPIHGANSNDSMPDRPVAAVLVRNASHKRLPSFRPQKRRLLIYIMYKVYSPIRQHSGRPH